MSRHIVYSVLAAAIFLAAACTEKDGPDKKTEPEGPTWPRKEICSILTVGKTESLDSIEYDDKGRVVKEMTFAVEFEELAGVKETYTYDYSDGKIERKFFYEGEETSATAVYNLGKDNRISDALVGGHWELVYTYDGNGYLTTIDQKKIQTVDLTWNGGDLISDSSGYTYTYSDFEAQGFFPPSVSPMDIWLYRQGYYGKMPKHLPSKAELEDEGEVHTFDYKFIGGLLVGYTETVTITSGSTPSVTETHVAINWKQY